MADPRVTTKDGDLFFNGRKVHQAWRTGDWTHFAIKQLMHENNDTKWYGVVMDTGGRLYDPVVWDAWTESELHADPQTETISKQHWPKYAVSPLLDF